MSNQELLEMAAKAVGSDYEVDNGRIEFVEPVGGWSGFWNPLKDDGDALRLAAELDMMISVNRVDGYTEASCGYSNANLVTIRESHGDIFYATRRAIVRAAAEIGKSLLELAKDD